VTRETKVQKVMMANLVKMAPMARMVSLVKMERTAPRVLQENKEQKVYIMLY
jgi:hypothetical protein